MTQKFLRKVFGRSEPISSDVRDALDQLDRLAEDRPTLAQPIAVLIEILPNLFGRDSQEIPNITDDALATKLQCGEPMLRNESIQVDVASFEQRWFTVCDAVQKHQSDPAAERLSAALRRGDLNANEMLSRVLAGESKTISEHVDALGIHPDLAATVLRFALLSALSQLSTALAPVRDQVRWRHGYCPTCGSWPLLAERRGIDQLRFLRCGLCTTAWEFPQLQCVFCETRDHNQLGFFHIEGEEERFRANTCAICRGYSKTASTLSELSAPQLLVMDVATMHLDLAAADRGYAVPS